MPQYDDKILGLVAREDYKPITLKAMSRRFDVAPEDYAGFRATVKAMVREGKLDLGKDKRLSKPLEAAKGTLVGTFRRTSKGFGFVRPQKSVGRDKDIFIPPDASLDASTGDVVAVKVMKRSHTPGNNNEGRIIRVVSRASGVFVGTYYEEGRSHSYVKVDGTTFHAPIYVGDPGAKGAKPGDKVAIEMVRYPSPEVEGEGVITEILGQRGQPGVDTLTVIRAFNIPDVFDDETLLDAREQAQAFDEDRIDTREDLRKVLTITIDPATARDFDDAISLSRDDRGFRTLGVHIADVSHFVTPGSPLDQTARKRGTSVYLPDRVIPMLPEVLSNSLASLQAGHTRYTMSVFMEFDPTGVRTDRRFARTAIRVDQRFSYEQAFACMSRPDEPIEGVSPEVRSLLSEMLDLARILRKRRFKRGALELTMPEVEVELGGRGRGRRRPPVARRREPPGHRGVHARGERGRGVVSDREARRVPPPRPRRPRAGQAQAVRRVRPGAGVLDREPPEPVRHPEGPRPHDRGARAVRGALRIPPQPQAGDLHPRDRGALRAGERGLLPLHLADPPLPPTSRSTASSARSSPARSPCRTPTNSSPWPSIAPGPRGAPRPPSARSSRSSC